MPGETRLESCGDAVDADVAREQVLEALHYFSSTSLSEILATRQSGEPEPEHLQQDLLRLFRATAQLVPAFAAFLADSGVSVDAIASVQDLCANVPLVDKVNYLQRYQLPQRCIGGALAVGDVDFCHVSSGSSGEPTFWARSTLSELTVATRFEQILCDNFRATETPLLCVNSVSSGQLGRRNLHHLLSPLLRHQGAQSHYSHPRQRPVRNPALHQSSRPSVSANVHTWLSSLREGAN